MPSDSLVATRTIERSHRTLRRFGFFVLAISAASAVLAQGCGAQGDDESTLDTPDNANAENHASVELRQRFPSVAEAILDTPNTFEANAEGFALRPQTSGASRVGIRLPNESAAALEIKTPDGFVVQVREEGASGAPFRASNAVGYTRAGGTSFWTVAASGLEEWLMLDAGTVRDDEPAATWHVEGGTLVERGDAVAIADEDGNMRMYVVAPKAYAKGGREVPVRLSVRGNDLSAFVTGAQGEEVLVDPGWTVAAPLATPRLYLAATTLVDGRVLVTGGINLPSSTSASASTELYNRISNTWTAGAPMAQGRAVASAVRMQDGRVLVTGGALNTGANSAQATGEIYNPATNTWSSAASMSLVKYAHRSVLLPSGKVLVVGGLTTTNVPIAAAELYDPAANAWTSAGTMSVGRSFPGAVLLNNGKVLVAGGGNPVTTLADLYDPATNTWTAAAPAANPYGSASSLLLSTGEAMLVGGTKAELYNTATNTWSAAGTLAVNRQFPPAVALLSGDSVILAGGTTATTAERFTYGTKTWAGDGALSVGRVLSADAVLTNGALLVAGGSPTGNAAVNVVDIYTPAAALGAACTVAADCGSGFCADGVCCDTACGGGIANDCEACSVATGATTNGTCALLSGTTCSDFDACTQTDTCTAGVCVGANPIVCTAIDECHDPGLCNTETGTCSNPDKADGSTCDDGNGCTQTDTCTAGVCGGANPVVCTAMDQCHDVGTCDAATGACSNPPKVDGTTCNDGSACTLSDTCVAGACTGANPITCTASDQCHDVGTCNSLTGLCDDPVKADGSACDDGDACTQTDSCTAGVCGGANPVVCTAMDQCHDVGTCDTATGACNNPAKADGTACNDGDACTQTDSCTAGVCGGANPVVCTAMDQCHDVGTCDAATGACNNPAKADGSTCDDGDACTQADSCTAGVCASTTPVTCTPSDDCHIAACDPTKGCAEQPAADGTKCSTGECRSGVCTPEGTGGMGGGGGTGGGGGSGEPVQIEGGCACTSAGTTTGNIPGGALLLGLSTLFLTRRRRHARR